MLVLVILLLFAMLFAAMTLSFRKISAITYTVLNNGLIGIGLILIAFAILMSSTAVLGAINNLSVGWAGVLLLPPVCVCVV